MSTGTTPVVLAEARWPEPGDPAAPPRLPGFVHSTFSPLVAAVADRCLRRHFGDRPDPLAAPRPTADPVVTDPPDAAVATDLTAAAAAAAVAAVAVTTDRTPAGIATDLTAAGDAPTGDGEPVTPVGPDLATSAERIAVLLVSASGDRASAEYVATTVAGGGRPAPLFFFQSVPNSVAGLVAARWGLGGPVVCLSPVGDPLAEALAEADLLLHDGDADAALLILIEQSADDRPDAAVALLVGGATEA